jgi:hypothetical protein
MAESVTVTAQGGTVRLVMAARTASDLGALQKGLKSLAERLGHPACATGCDILHLMTEREFTLGSTVELNPQPLPPRVEINPQPLPPRAEAAASARELPRTVTVSLPSEVSGDINALTKAVATVMGKLGCPACCSGFDIQFRREIDLLVLDDQLHVQGFGRFR